MKPDSMDTVFCVPLASYLRRCEASDFDCELYAQGARVAAMPGVSAVAVVVRRGMERGVWALFAPEEVFLVAQLVGAVELPQPEAET